MGNSALERAVKLAGGKTALADLIGTDKRNIWWWLNRSKKGVAAEFAPKIETATNGAVTRYQLRPDVFGEAP